MDVIICVNHAKMQGANIVVNATLFNDNIKKVRFYIDNDNKKEAERICISNKTRDVEFSGLRYGLGYSVYCEALDGDLWTSVGKVIVSTNTNLTCDEIEFQEVQRTYQQNIPRKTSQIGSVDIWG